MNTKSLLANLPIIAVAVCALMSCSGKQKEINENVIATAQRDAAKVAEAPEKSMQREHAVLAIRVREHALRSNGYEQEADLYYSTAHSILVDSLHIIEDRTNVNEY